MSDKCHDCGEWLTTVNQKRLCDLRWDICDDCWNNRGWIVRNAQRIGLENLHDVQRAMKSHRGTAKRRIRYLKIQYPEVRE